MFPIKRICPVTMAKQQDYKIVFVAMYYDVDGTTPVNPAYGIDAAAYTLAVPSTALANSDKYDLFYGVDEVEDFQGVQTTNVTLNRVVAQINFELSDNAWTSLGVDASFKSGITISNAPSSMNLWDGTLSGTASVAYEIAAIPAEGRKIGTAYCLASAEGNQKVDVAISLRNAAGYEVKAAAATAVPVSANKQTNLIIN